MAERAVHWTPAQRAWHRRFRTARVYGREHLLAILLAFSLVLAALDTMFFHNIARLEPREGSQSATIGHPR